MEKNASDFAVFPLPKPNREPGVGTLRAIHARFDGAVVFIPNRDALGQLGDNSIRHRSPRTNAVTAQPGCTWQFQMTR